MEYIDFTTESQISEIIDRSKLQKGVLIFKHSTRCPISSMALNNFNKGWDIAEEQIPVYFLDILNYRSLSNEIADRFGVQHESPQILYINDGKCTYNASHMAISPSAIKDFTI